MFPVLGVFPFFVVKGLKRLELRLGILIIGHNPKVETAIVQCDAERRGLHITVSSGRAVM